MRCSGLRLVGAGMLVFAAALAAGVRGLAGSSPGPDAPVPVDYGSGVYVGSQACARCHDAVFEAWRGSLHVQMTRPIAEAQVIGDFSPGAHLERYGRAYRMMRRDGRYLVSVSHQGRPPETFEVHYTLGVNRFQGYLSTLPDGRIYVLPVFWHRETHQWIDYQEITPIPRDPDHEFRQIWNVNCFNCHATNLVQGFDPATRTYATTWTELGIGCEACHGPGGAHVALMREWEARPDAKPAYDASARNRELSRLLRIFAPRSASRRQVFDTCAYCHGNKTNLYVGFRPGDRYEDFAVPFLVSQPIPPEDPQGDYWPDGRPTRFNRPQALMQSGCFLRGDATCTSCHTIHGAKHPHALKVAPAERDRLCTQCHRAYDGPARAAHTHHPSDSPGSGCVACHMSEVNWRLLMRRRDHTFAPPVPELTARYGVPNACTTCHDDRSPEWAARTMDDWWGERDRARRAGVVRRAEVLYAAGRGDRGALPDLARLAVDRAQPPPIRASAAEFIGRLAASVAPAEATRLLTPVVNGLAAAAADPEPIVRLTAARALGLVLERTGDRARASPLAARLADPVRSVRAVAAEALLRLGVATLGGAADAALARAQDDYAAMLRAFPDNARNQTDLAWLELARGRLADAERALAAARALDPARAEPLVLEGVLHARRGRYADAIAVWRRAQQLDPRDPRPPRLIAEAERRLPAP
jgi:predicted CXXCH cytochrome family protein